MKTSALTFAPIVSALVAICLAGRGSGQERLDRGVEQAAFSRTGASGTAQQVRFSRQVAHVGDQAEQDIGLELRLKMSMRQANQLIGQNQTTVCTNQRRVVTTTEVDNGRMIAVRVHYPAALKQESATDANGKPVEPTLQPQPVQGKTYICRRELGENGELIVTDEAGQRPPTDEYEIVSQQMQMVGRPNPLAQFLAGRTIAVGEKIELPNDIAGQLFNLSDRFGKVTRFTLTLQKVQSEGGATCAVFQASVVAAASAATQMRLEVEGPLVVDVATCRAQRIRLLGPIGMSETRGSYSTAYQMIGTGRLQMSIASVYRDAKR